MERTSLMKEPIMRVTIVHPSDTFGVILPPPVNDDDFWYLSVILVNGRK
jgi:hypothetical protein